MELLLNIIWLALAVPAVWMWHRKPRCAHHPQWLERCRPFILLGCALLLLFPVVSATDDLNAMRPEMEESNPSTRQIKHSPAGRSNLWTPATGTVLAQHVGLSFLPPDEPCGLVCTPSAGLPESVSVRQSVSRGPPADGLA